MYSAPGTCGSQCGNQVTSCTGRLSHNLFCSVPDPLADPLLNWKGFQPGPDGSDPLALRWGWGGLRMRFFETKTSGNQVQRNADPDSSIRLISQVLRAEPETIRVYFCQTCPRGNTQCKQIRGLSIEFWLIHGPNVTAETL